jgi:hypothetical protein
LDQFPFVVSIAPASGSNYGWGYFIETSSALFRDLDSALKTVLDVTGGAYPEQEIANQ